MLSTRDLLQTRERQDRERSARAARSNTARRRDDRALGRCQLGGRRRGGGRVDQDVHRHVRWARAGQSPKHRLARPSRTFRSRHNRAWWSRAARIRSRRYDRVQAFLRRAESAQAAGRGRRRRAQRVQRSLLDRSRQGRPARDRAARSGSTHPSSWRVCSTTAARRITCRPRTRGRPLATSSPRSCGTTWVSIPNRSGLGEGTGAVFAPTSVTYVVVSD